MKYIAYITTNIKNNKIYLGVHKTENPEIFDGYIGCGVNIFRSGTYKKSKTPFQYAVNKYGVDCFKRNVIKIFETKEAALAFEASVVDEEFIKREDTYNVALGGGKIPDTSKNTYQYSLNGEFIKEWKSAVDAARHYEINPSSINTAIIYKTTSCSSLWSLEKYDKLDINGFTIYNIEKVIYEYSLEGNLTNSYISITEAANTLNTTTSNILRSLKGEYKIKNHYYSYKLVSVFTPKEVKSIKNKKLYAYLENGEFAKEYLSPEQAVKELNLKSSSVINTAMRTGRSCGGFQWNLEKVPFMKELIPDKPKRVKIGQYTLEGILVKEFDTIKQTKAEFGSGVQKAIDGKISSFKGFIFKKLS